jgi:hypothetical protein
MRNPQRQDIWTLVQTESQHQNTANRYGQVCISGGKVPGCAGHIHPDPKYHINVNNEADDKTKKLD